MKKIQLRTIKKSQFMDITHAVKSEIESMGITDGACVIFCPHTTAGITINEAYDAAVQDDMAFSFDKISPNYPQFRHMEGNSDAHVKASLIGSSETVIIQNGELMLGTWQGIYFTEFDGPRSREVWITTL